MYNLKQIERKDVVEREKYVIVVPDGDNSFWTVAHLSVLGKNLMWSWGKWEGQQHLDDDSVLIFKVVKSS
jgi:hypothetical protein